ncbi:GDSL esterase/lipase At1g71250-like [Panicum virgatum]|uniref:GDSL esterase/lipase At1g71250-like n=1 Tax=Panicum virgatum TaxID=38727 RepID=UPI0019D66C19|nr:GDSL esterase/lipase At1g71250-like [Panicum virgatum]
MAAFAATHQQTDVAAFYSSLIFNYSAAITELYGMGARKFGVINIGQIGCAPLQRLQSPTGACADAVNALAAGFDDALRSLLASGLPHGLPGLAYSLGDLLGAQSGCQQPNSTLCADRRSYLFWDYGHPTQRGAELIATTFYDGPVRFTLPVNLKQLMLS